MLRYSALAAVTLTCLPHWAWAADPAVSYERDVRPILKANCFHCHGGEGEAKANLDLRLRRFIVKGGDQGPSVEPGKRDDSLLFERISKGEMPPGGKHLAPEQVEIIGKWIDGGAPTLREEPEQLNSGVDITPEERAFWSFQPIQNPAVPATAAADGARTEIDALLLPALKGKGLAFNSEADKVTLLKRLMLDLHGLPPSPEEVAEFAADTAPDAYERLVERLLMSHRYGERWARHWLDAAGYADSDGYSAEDFVRPEAYKYRDYVIRSLNANKPVDQFLIEQFAGDELLQAHPGDYRPEEIELLTATGFLRMGPDGTNSGAVDQDVARNQVVSDTIKIVSTSMLGLSVGCCQCHDHRYDPIPQADYFRLRAVFEPAYDWKSWRAPSSRRISLMTAEDRQKVAVIDAEAAVIVQEKNKKQEEYIAATFTKELEKFPAEQREALRTAFMLADDKRSLEQKKLVAENPSLNINAGVLYQYDAAAAEELKKFDERIGQVQAKKPVEEFVAALTEVPGQVPATFLFYRGDQRQPQQEIAPGGLTILSTPGQRLEIAKKNEQLPTTGRRLAFAKWLVGDQNPVTARVLVNRIWLGHFGRGLVNTPSDFGALGEKPTNPELLDWLAHDFRTHGWDLKRLHRQIVTSTAYRQSAVRDAKRTELDSEGQLLSHWPLRRLDAETLRDRMLFATGVLFDKQFGPAIPVKEDDVGQVVVAVDPPAPSIQLSPSSEAFRRSVYVQVRRSQPLAFLQSFDSPVMETNCDKRIASTVPTQALMLMNSDFVLKQSQYFAYRLRRERGEDVVAQVQRAWQLAFLREPTALELQQATDFINQRTAKLKAQTPPDPEASLNPFVSLCQILLSSNEFLYVE
ncbi:MAG: PSD1 and planctomycete cytochrome C domain-containing protein [Planctomycetota bacterium]